MNLPVIAADKANHALYGAAVFVLVAGAAAQLASVPAPFARGLGLLCAFAAGLAKEWLDRRANKRALQRGQDAPHTVDHADVWATVAGGALCWLASAASVPGGAL
jgi:hypothetical protein